MTDDEVMLNLYIEAEKAVLEGKTVNFRGEMVGMEDLAEIRKGRQEWERRVNQKGKPHSLVTFS